MAKFLLFTTLAAAALAPGEEPATEDSDTGGPTTQ
jgi:hypothetical protein